VLEDLFENITPRDVIKCSRCDVIAFQKIIKEKYDFYSYLVEALPSFFEKIIVSRYTVNTAESCMIA
jgi:hypothetical protein